MNSDLTFITNEEGKTLKERFKVLIKDSQFFDCLVGYFFSSGFYAIYKELEKTEKIRILIGISTNKQVFDLIDTSADLFANPGNIQLKIRASHAQIKQDFENITASELENSQDNRQTEEAVTKFVEWINSGKLVVKAYPSQNIHAKLYIMTFLEGDRDTGRVITGSSNFSQSGLEDNLEFNVELKNRTDYEFAKDNFNNLWKDAVDVSDKYIQTIKEKTWLSSDISPYELYLKFLYEYFKDELSQTGELIPVYLPEKFLKLEYQDQAVLNAKRILGDYGGVFISDVVGLGKTYISAMLASQLDGRNLVIAPPALLKETNPGSWPNVFYEFKISAIFKSVGKLDEILKLNPDLYSNVFIDEAHRFRTEKTISYEKLARICRGKRVILVTATPYNNSPDDILNQIKLFQSPRKSTIPNLANLEGFFGSLKSRLEKINRKTDYGNYINTVKDNASQIREKVLKYLMVRRTRKEIEHYFKKDLEVQGLKFPEVKSPKPLFYELNETEDEIFGSTIELIAKSFNYARYMPLLYYRGKITQLEKQSQRNMGKFMKVLLVKRLESSFYAFRKTLDRFIRSHEIFIREFDKGNVYISKKIANKVFDLLENDQDEKIEEFIELGKIEQYPSEEFDGSLRDDLKSDLNTLYAIKERWQAIKRDPKLIKFMDSLQSSPTLKKNKLIIFTESKETAEYLNKNINEKLGSIALSFSGSSPEGVRDKVIENFDARAAKSKDDYRVLISTEVLSEGVNLHRSNVVINYDIPWNPTRMMQRVGRINRVDTKFDKIYTFNFFPTRQANEEIKLREIAISKISAFLTLLGGDAEILTEGEPIGSHELFNRLISKKTITGEEDPEQSELKYLTFIKDIRDSDEALFAKIKRLARKSRTSKKTTEPKNRLITYFRKDKLDKFYISGHEDNPEELDFISAAKILESDPDEKKHKIGKNYYELLDKNKEAFDNATTEELANQQYKKKGRDLSTKVLAVVKFTLKNTQKLTDNQEEYLQKLKEKLEEGSIPKQTLKKAMVSIDRLGAKELSNPLKVLATLQMSISDRLLGSHYVETSSIGNSKKEVILSLYLTGDN